MASDELVDKYLPGALQYMEKNLWSTPEEKLLLQKILDEDEDEDEDDDEDEDFAKWKDVKIEPLQLSEFPGGPSRFKTIRQRLPEGFPLDKYIDKQIAKLTRDGILVTAEDDDKEEDCAEGENESANQSKSERKSRKAMQKNTRFIIKKADVFKSPNSDTYVKFGEAEIEDLSSQPETRATQQFKKPDMPKISEAGAGVLEDKEVDDTGVGAPDIELV